MFRIVALLPLLASCDLISSGGAGRVQDAPDAPYSLSGARAFLWAADPGAQSGYGQGLLVIADSDMTCTELTDSAMYDWESLVSSGSGLIFVVYHYTWDGESGPIDWEGLYMGGYSYSYSEETERSMVAAGFNEGYFFTIASYGSGWVRIDQATEDKVTGEFSTTYWRGDFHAEMCGNWNGSPYYYYYYD